jgi:hypothetical protein
MTDRRASPIIVKRYADRRLYDAAGLRYLSRAALRRMVRDGVAVVVEDAATGDDVTADGLADADDVARWGATVDGLAGVALDAAGDAAPDANKAGADEADAMRRLIARRIGPVMRARGIAANLPARWSRDRRAALRLIDPAPERDVDPSPRALADARSPPTPAMREREGARAARPRGKGEG